MNTSKGMSGHHVPSIGQYTGWQTPPWIIDALGKFDMDPCLPGIKNGLEMEWHGRIWLNPPYDKTIGLWLKKLADHNNGIALIFARTETKHFHEQVWQRASGIFFFKGRLHFYKEGIRSKYNAGAPSCLISYGVDNDTYLGYAVKVRKLSGFYISLTDSYTFADFISDSGMTGLEVPDAK